MINTYFVEITRWFPCPTEEAFDAWAEELSGAWISHSALNPLIGEFRSDDHSYTFRKAVDADSPLDAIHIVYEGVHRALDHLEPREDVRTSPAIRIEVNIEENPIDNIPTSDDQQDRVRRTGRVGE